MTWAWLSAAAVLTGALLNAEAERQTARDTTVGPPAATGLDSGEPRGRR
jgi:membrane protein